MSSKCNDRSKIFVQNRALGYVSNEIPHVVRYIKRRKENLVVTCVGKAFHTYGCDRFNLLSVSPQHNFNISCLSADTFLVYTASGCDIYAWRRGTELKHTYKSHSKPVHLLLPFGPHLISVDEDSYLNVWDIKSEDLYLQLNFDNDSFRVTAICHPSTYINKILLGSEQGGLQLWNLNSSKLIYSFNGWSSPITVLEQTPALDVVAIGLKNGTIILHNLKCDKTVLRFMQDWGPVTSLSFRTDGPPIMASASIVGHVVFWNLEERKVMSQLLNAHDCGVTGMNCLPNEPLLVTSSQDNSLKLWIFDMSNGGARLLRFREGHHLPPTFIRFYDQLGSNILSAGADSSMRIFNLVTEIANKSLGKASHDKKASKKNVKKAKYLTMTPIVNFTTGIPTNIEFDNIAAIHSNCAKVSTWSSYYERMSEVHLIHNRFKPRNNKAMKGVACSVCFSRCMNFVIVGYSTGHVDKFNIQSGICRGSYGELTAHCGPVRGIAVDGINRVLVTGGSDQYVKFWSFKLCNKPCFSEILLDDAVEFFYSHQESSMLAVALEDYSIFLIDIETRTITRKFIGHTGLLNDVTFSPDSRWIISASMDGTIRTWDIPSGQLVDYILVEVPCISLSFSPTGEYLATIHVDSLGIYLWTNMTLFTHITLKPIVEIPKIVPLILKTFDELEETPQIHIIDEEDDAENFKDQIDDLITLTQAVSVRWQTILDIDIIQKRNKPKEPPKKPEAAPFFIPTIPALNTEFDFSDIQQEKDNAIKNKFSTTWNLTVFGKHLHETISNNDFTTVIENIKVMSPSAINMEVNSLSFNEDTCPELLLQFMKMIENMYNSRKDFELAQSYFGIFLKTHSDTIIKHSELIQCLTRLQSLQENMWMKLENKLLYCISVVDYLKNC